MLDLRYLTILLLKRFMLLLVLRRNEILLDTKMHEPSQTEKLSDTLVSLRLNLERGRQHRLPLLEEVSGDGCDTLYRSSPPSLR